MRHYLMMIMLLCSLQGYSQEVVLQGINDDSFFLLPGFVASSGESMLFSSNSNGITLYDEDFKAVKTMNFNRTDNTYKQRVVTMVRIYDDDQKKFLTDDWVVESDITYDNCVLPGGPVCIHFCSDQTDWNSSITSNTQQLNGAYLTQTLFNNDEDFEVLMPRVEVIPVDVQLPRTSSDEECLETWGIDADGFTDVWLMDETTGRQTKPGIRFYKILTYGGYKLLPNTDIVSENGTVKGTINGYHINYARLLHYRNSNYLFADCIGAEGTLETVVLSIKPGETQVKEIYHAKALQSMKLEGKFLYVNGDSKENGSVVVSSMNGQLVTQKIAQKGKAVIPVNGWPKGVYHVTLFNDNQRPCSSKIVIK